MREELYIPTYEEQVIEYEKAMASDWEQKPYNEFLDLVTQRPDPTLDQQKPFCPFCNNESVHVIGRRTTLVGFDVIDTNHVWIHCSCKACNKSWIVEVKGDHSINGYNVWYTKDDKVLMGIPTCFESYIYTCRHCGGDVVRNYYDKGTRNETKYLSIGKEKSYDTFFSCTKCHAEVWCSNDYYFFVSPHRPRKPFNPKNLPMIYEETGMVVVNDWATTKVRIEGIDDEND